MAKAIILKKIKEYNTIIIHGHIRPDGDCYGSQYGLKNIIKESFPHKNVYVVGQESDYIKTKKTYEFCTSSNNKHIEDFLLKLDKIDDGLKLKISLQY